jgi:cyanophycinase
MEAVDAELIARLNAPVTVTCLPTVAGQEGSDRIDYWSRLGVDHFTKLGVQASAVPVIDRASANDPAFAQAVENSNFIYYSGGKPDYLYATLNGSLVWQATQRVLARGGIVAGCSAGAMIMSDQFFGFPNAHAGFGSLPGVTVVPHYDEMPEAMIGPIRAIFGRSLTLVGIEGYTALVQHENGYEVLGSGGVTVWNNQLKIRYPQGPIPSEVLAR